MEERSHTVWSGKQLATRLRSGQDGVCAEGTVAPGYLANHAARVFNRLTDQALRPNGVTLSLLGPLLLLSRRGPMLQRDLVHESAVAQPAMVALLSKLEAAGFIRRAPSPGDRRAAEVSLTISGRKTAEQGARALIDVNAGGLKGFSAGEAQTLTMLLQRLIANMEGTV